MQFTNHSLAYVAPVLSHSDIKLRTVVAEHSYRYSISADPCSVSWSHVHDGQGVLCLANLS